MAYRRHPKWGPNKRQIFVLWDSDPTYFVGLNNYQKWGLFQWPVERFQLVLIWWWGAVGLGLVLSTG